MDIGLASWLLQQHQYIFLFFGGLIGGEWVQLPVIYLAVTGALEPSIVFFWCLAGIFVSDVVWFFIGRWLTMERIMELGPIKKRERMVNYFLKWFDKHDLKILYISDFIYGLRIPVQVMLGARRLPFYKFFIVDLLGVGSYLLLLFGLGFAFNESLTSFEQIVEQTRTIAFFLFAASIFLVNWWIKKKLDQQVPEEEVSDQKQRQKA